MKRLSILFFLLLFGFVFAGRAYAEYPEKPVNVIIPFAPGGTTDLTVRMLGKALEKSLGQPLVITNKGGGAGVPGFRSALKAKPDGYTIIGGCPGASIGATYFLNSEPFNLDDMVFVGGYAIPDRVLLAKKDKPYKTWQEFVEYARENPGKVSVGSGASQEAMEILRAAAIKEGLDYNLTMYKSGGEASADLLGGHIDVCEVGVGTPAFQAARNGDLNILANLGIGEVLGFPDTPHLKDFGFPFSIINIYGFVLPKGTPEEARAKWEKALESAVNDPEVKNNIEKMGIKVKFINGADYEKLSREAVKSIPALLEFNKQAKK